MFWQFWLAIRFVCHCCDSNSFTFQLFLMWFQCYPVWEIFSHLFLCFVRFHFSFNFRSHTLRKFCYENVVIVVAENEKQKKCFVTAKTSQHKTAARTKKLDLSPEQCMLHVSACVYKWKITCGQREPRTSSDSVFSLARLLARINNKQQQQKHKTKQRTQKTREKEISRK